jgi:hypothetical protein
MLPAPSRLSDRTHTTWLPTTFCWVSILFASASTFASAQEKSRSLEHLNHAKLSTVADRIVENFMQRKHVPGLVLAALRDGNLVVKKGYGVLSSNDKRRPDSDTLFYIGSISKAITGVGIELLAEQGKLQLNEPASRHLQDLPKSWRRITTLGDLLRLYRAIQRHRLLPAPRARNDFAGDTGPDRHARLVCSRSERCDDRCQGRRRGGLFEPVSVRPRPR